MSAFGHLPKRNEVVELGEFRFRVLNADSRRVHLLRLSPLQTERAPPPRRRGIFPPSFWRLASPSLLLRLAPDSPVAADVAVRQPKAAPVCAVGH